MAIIKHKEQRVGVYIDTQNIYHSGKNLYHSKVNFGQIVKDALDGRKLIRAVAYVIATESGEENAFFEALTKMGIETKVKYLQMNQGCQVEVVSFGKSTSAKLIESADHFTDLDENASKYLLRTGGKNK